MKSLFLKEQLIILKKR